MVDIELATSDDLPRIVAISNRAAERGTANFATEPEPLEKWQRAYAETRERYPWLVARAGGDVVGFAKASPHRTRRAYDHTCEVSVYLDEAWQGRRVGSALYAALLPMLSAQGYRLLLAGITAGNEVSERLHARVGFVRCGTFHRVGWKFGAWHDVGYWELLLDPNLATPRRLRAVAEVPLIRRAALDGPEARALIGELNAELTARYPEPGATHFDLDPDEVAPGAGSFLIAWLGADAIACGAIRRLDPGTGEVKRMYVRPAARRGGLGAVLLGALELEARLLGIGRLVLETGSRQVEACALYERAGFRLIPRFGKYVGSPLSICFEKILTRPRGARRWGGWRAAPSPAARSGRRGAPPDSGADGSGPRRGSA